MRAIASAGRPTPTHPTTWWLVGLGAGLAATLANNAIFSAVVCLGSISVLVLVRKQERTANALKFYLFSALIFVAIKVTLRTVFGEQPINLDALAQSFGDALRVAAILLSAGLANTMSDPRKLLRSTPPALQQLATAIAIAVNLAPQLISSFSRVRRAARLRGRSRGLGAFKSIVIPTLTEALESSITLASSMEARGFGRRELRTKRSARLATVFAGSALLSIGAAAYLVTFTNQPWLTSAFGALGILLVMLYLRNLGRDTKRTRYSIQSFRTMDRLAWGFSAVLLIAAVLVNNLGVLGV